MHLIKIRVFILREMIKDVYEETGSFENIPDMLTTISDVFDKA